MQSKVSQRNYNHKIKDLLNSWLNDNYPQRTIKELISLHRQLDDAIELVKAGLDETQINAGNMNILVSKLELKDNGLFSGPPSIFNVDNLWFSIMII